MRLPLTSPTGGGTPQKVKSITLMVDTTLLNAEQKRFHDYYVLVYRDELPRDQWAVTGQPLFVAPSGNTRNPINQGIYVDLPTLICIYMRQKGFLFFKIFKKKSSSTMSKITQPPIGSFPLYHTH